MDAVASWSRSDVPVALATVVRTSGSSPRPVGASMAVGPEGEAVGSVSGGCVEGAVYERAREVIATGVPILEHYGFSDGDAFAVGLTCGGELDVFVERVDRSSFPLLDTLQADIAAHRPVAVATVLSHPSPALVGRRALVRTGSDRPLTDSLGSARIDGTVGDDALGMLASGTSGVLTYGPEGERLGTGLEVFVETFAPKPRMIVFGAIDFAAAACSLGAFLGYDVTVCDARPVFATASRFPDADRVVVDWPHRYLAAEHASRRIDTRTVVLVLTHDPKFDVPVLETALRLPLAYVGAMGSRRTHDDRDARLRDAGLQPDELARLHSPIGLDLGARTPEETAVSIAAQVIASRWGGTGQPLAARTGAIHRA